MFWLLLAELAMLPCTFIGHILIHIIVPAKRPLLFASLATSISGVIWAVNHFLLPQFSLSFGLLIFLTDLILIFCFFSGGKRALAFLTYALLSLIQFIASFIFLTVSASLLKIDPIVLTKTDQFMYPIACFFTTIVASLLMYLFILLFKRILPPIKESRILMAFVFLFFSQILVFYLGTHLFIYGKSVDGLGITYSVTMIFYLAAGIAFLIGYRSMRQIDLNELNARQVEEQLQMQVSHYEQLQNDILQINQIRHDLSNQLQAAYYLLEQGESDQVRSQLDLLNAEIRNKVGPTYCTNLIADAILTEKAKLCEKNGIPILFSVFLPQDLPLEAAHLCSIFSNILDNSINATLKTPRPYGQLELSADIHSSFVTIKSSNPAPPLKPAKNTEPLRPHGLGLEILRSITQKYGGTMNTSWKNGRFYLSIILKANS